MAMVMDLANGAHHAAIVFFDIERIARQPGPAGIDELGGGDEDLGDEGHYSLRSLRSRSRIAWACGSLSRSPTGRRLRRRQFGYSRFVPGTLSCSASPKRSSTCAKAMADPVRARNSCAAII